jgi:ABC-type lipopolysaccharide export system ATPase subunit
VFLEKGTVRFSGAAADLAERDDLLRSVFLEGGGRQVSPAPSGPSAAGSEILACDDLSVRFGGLTAVDGAGLTVREGEIVGLIGPNGAGKTTLVDALSGFVRPDVGRVRFAGADVTGLGPRLRALSGLARSFQDSRLFPGLTVGESLAVASERTAAPPGPLSAGLRLPGSGQFETMVGERVETLMADLGLEAWRDRFPSQLSTGVRRLVELGSLCSTNRRPASPSPRRRRSAGCSVGCATAPAAPSSSWPTTYRCCWPSPTGWWRWISAASSPTAHRPTWSGIRPSSARIWAAPPTVP